MSPWPRSFSASLLVGRNDYQLDAGTSKPRAKSKIMHKTDPAHIQSSQPLAEYGDPACSVIACRTMDIVQLKEKCRDWKTDIIKYGLQTIDHIEPIA